MTILCNKLALALVLRNTERKWVQRKEFDIVNGSFCNLCALALGWRYILSLHCADELQQERNSCPQLRSCFIGSGHVGISKRFPVVSALQSIAFIHILFWLIRSLVDPTLAAFIVCGSLQLIVSYEFSDRRSF